MFELMNYASCIPATFVPLVQRLILGITRDAHILDVNFHEEFRMIVYGFNILDLTMGLDNILITRFDMYFIYTYINFPLILGSFN